MTDFPAPDSGTEVFDVALAERTAIEAFLKDEPAYAKLLEERSAALLDNNAPAYRCADLAVTQHELRAVKAHRLAESLSAGLPFPGTPIFD